MNISHFDDLLLAARQQAEPQRLLLVFATASLPDDATAEQRASFEAGESGELAPQMCVDKDPHALSSFATLLAESAEASDQPTPWALVFAAALPGSDGKPPSASRIENALQQMTEQVRSGDIERLISFDRLGHAVNLG